MQVPCSSSAVELIVMVLEKAFNQTSVSFFVHVCLWKLPYVRPRLSCKVDFFVTAAAGILIMWQCYQGEPSQRLQIMPS